MFDFVIILLFLYIIAIPVFHFLIHINAVYKTFEESIYDYKKNFYDVSEFTLIGKIIYYIIFAPTAFYIVVIKFTIKIVKVVKKIIFKEQK